MKKKLIIAAVILCAVIVIYFAQKKDDMNQQTDTTPVAETTPTPAPAAPAKPIDAKDLEIATKIAKAFGPNERLRNSLSGMMAGMMPPVYQANPGQMKKIQKVMDEALDKVVAAHDEDAQKDKAEFFAQNFTTDELEQLASFYESSAGQKTVKLSDEMSRHDSMFGQSVVMSASLQVRDELLKALKKNDIKVPKSIGGTE